MLMQARAQHFYLCFVMSSDTAPGQMREGFAETDTRLPPLERARLGAQGTVFASPEVRGLYELLFGADRREPQPEGDPSAAWARHDGRDDGHLRAPVPRLREPRPRRRRGRARRCSGGTGTEQGG